MDDVDEYTFAFTEQAWRVWRNLQPSCTGLALMLGGPIYLCGSVLYDEHPGDIDLRCCMEMEDIDAMFGEGAAHDNMSLNYLRRMREELKQSRRLMARFKKFKWPRIDFQIQPVLFHTGTVEPIDGRGRLRVDVVPDYMFNAGKSKP